MSTPDHHDSERTTPARIFGLLGAYAIGLGLVYGATTDERTGLALLLITGIGSLGFALWLHQHRHDAPNDGPTSPLPTLSPQLDPPPFVPPTSTAPLLLGTGVTLVVAGIPLGVWVVVPGMVLVAWGIDRFIRQVIDHR